MTEFLSDHLKATRDAFKHHVHGGKRFTSEEIAGLVDRLDELVSMALSQENEISRHKWNDAARSDNALSAGGNVVAFPGSRPTPVHRPNGGGDAA